MSKAYAKKYPEKVKPSRTTPEMREHVQRRGTVDEDGNIVYLTEQAHKDRCNINSIMAKYDKNGLITHISKFESEFGDTTGIEFKQMMDKVASARSSFEELPSKIRKRFDNDPTKLLQFMDDASNREEAIKLGLIRNTWTEETDGLGEHNKTGQHDHKPPLPLKEDKPSD